MNDQATDANTADSIAEESIVNTGSDSTAGTTTDVDVSPVGSFFRHTGLVWKRELGSYFSSPIAYVFITAFLLAIGALFLFVEDFFARGQASVAPMFEWIPRLFVVLVPAITMRLWAEERNSGTIEVLMTLPLRVSEIVIGKFLGAWSFLCIAALFTLPIPMLVGLTAYGEHGLSWGMVWGGYVGTFLLGAALISLGTFLSSLFRNQILAFVITFVACAALTFMGEDLILDYVHGGMPGLAAVLSYVSPGPHFLQISEGIVPLKSIIYFISLSVLFLFLNQNVLRSWRHTS